MPTYRYKCTPCGEYFEYLLPFDESEKDFLCPNSCGTHLKKVFMPAGIVFKGTGFYSTDKRGKNAQPEKGTTETKPTAKTVKPEGDKGSNGTKDKGMGSYSER